MLLWGQFFRLKLGLPRLPHLLGGEAAGWI
jgi:hypothetical protein